MKSMSVWDLYAGHKTYVPKGKFIQFLFSLYHNNMFGASYKLDIRKQRNGDLIIRPGK